MTEEPSPCEKCCRGYKMTVAVAVRLLLLIHAGVAVWLVVSLTGKNELWALLAISGLVVVEAVYTLVKRKGHESKWICPCFLAYLAAVLPPIWLVELHRLNTFNDAVSTTNITSLVQVNGLTVPIKLKPDVWVSVIEQTLLFLLVLCRWMLPRGDISRHELSQLLFVFMGIASDNMELFGLFDETEVRKDLILTFVILGVWSLSLLQFVFVLTATRNPRKIRVLHDEQSDNATETQRQKKGKKRGFCEVLFTTEIWSLLFSIMVQDGPYAATRIYTLIKHDLFTYSIIFFICKNLLIICIVFYRLVIICLHQILDDDDDDDDKRHEASFYEYQGDAERNSRSSSNARSIKVRPISDDKVEKNVQGFDTWSRASTTQK